MTPEYAILRAGRVLISVPTRYTAERLSRTRTFAGVVCRLVWGEWCPC